MSEIMRVIKGDTNSIQWTCTDENGGAINLTNVSTITLKVGRINESSNLIEKAGTKTDAANGVVQFAFLSTDFATEGYYDAHIELDYNTGVHKTLRNMDVHVLPDM